MIIKAKKNTQPKSEPEVSEHRVQFNTYLDALHERAKDNEKSAALLIRLQNRGIVMYPIEGFKKDE